MYESDNDCADHVVAVFFVCIFRIVGRKEVNMILRDMEQG